MKKIGATLRSAFLLLLLLTLLLGIVYPLLVTVIGQALFHDRANGSLIMRGDTIVGSRLLGQSFQNPRYFWGRLSATTPPYNPSASSGSNMNPGNPKLLDAVNERLSALHKADPANHAPVPVDLVTASASGVDPHISLAAAMYQLPRVAAARGKRVEDIKPIVDSYTETPGFGLLGTPYVNVLLVNKALDEMAGSK